MNIFVLDEDPYLASQYHTDKHTIKQILESVQILCASHHKTGTTLNVPYRLTHKNHPVCKWVAEDLNNYKWLCHLTKGLCKEYTYRYDKIHKCEEVLKWCLLNLPNIPSVKQTSFALAMPDDCKTDDAVKSYRNYYNKYKRHLFSWKRRGKPFWIEEENV